MRNVWMLLALAVFSAAAVATTPQHEKMKACNAQAKKSDLRGEERKKFMSQCLSAASAPAASAPAARAAAESVEKKPTAQQEKMNTCNADAKAKNLRGEPRKKFMSRCLKG
jgi:psiF repeat